MPALRTPTVFLNHITIHNNNHAKTLQLIQFNSEHLVYQA